MIYSLATAFSLIAVLSILLLASAVLDKQDVVRQVMRGCSLVMFLSLIVYFAIPEFGRQHVWVNGLLVTGKRIGASPEARMLSALSRPLLFCVYTTIVGICDDRFRLSSGFELALICLRY